MMATGDPRWSSPFLKDYIPWKGPMLEKFMKACIPWEGPLTEDRDERHRMLSLLQPAFPVPLHHSGGRRVRSEAEPGKKFGGKGEKVDYLSLFLTILVCYN